MTHEERVKGIAELGFTERQSGFLVNVMLHSGVCLPRQYCAFARIARGQKMVDFFERLVSNHYATPHACGRVGSRVYHVHNAKLYTAIGQRHARLRKPAALARTIERLMVLDHVIAHRDLLWLGAEEDKLVHFLSRTTVQQDELPRLVFGSGADVTVRCFPDKLPIGVSQDLSSHVFVYLLVDVFPADFRAFLRRHAELLRGLSAWSVRLLVPPKKEHRVKEYRRAFDEELAMPLHPQVAQEFLWFCRQRQAVPTDQDERLRRARRAFRSPRFRVLQRAWRQDGDRVVDTAMSTAIADAIARGQGRFESYELARQYLHLSPLVGTA